MNISEDGVMLYGIRSSHIIYSRPLFIRRATPWVRNKFQKLILLNGWSDWCVLLLMFTFGCQYSHAWKIFSWNQKCWNLLLYTSKKKRLFMINLCEMYAINVWKIDLCGIDTIYYQIQQMPVLIGIYCIIYLH